MKILCSLLLSLALCSSAEEFKLLSAPAPGATNQLTLCELVIGSAVLVVGGVMIYKICNASFWSNMPPSPPPVTNTSATNSVPTNNPPPAPKKWWHLGFVNSGSITNPAILLGGSGTATTNGDGLIFTSYSRVLFTGLQSSPDLKNWQSLTADCWSGQSGQLVVLCDGRGKPIYTNYSHADFLISDLPVDPTEPQIFYRCRP